MTYKYVAYKNMQISNERLKKIIKEQSDYCFFINTRIESLPAYFACKCGYLHCIYNTAPRKVEKNINQDVKLKISENSMRIGKLVICPYNGKEYPFNIVHPSCNQCYSQQLIHVLQINGYKFDEIISIVSYNVTTDINKPEIQAEITKCIDEFKSVTDPKFDIFQANFPYHIILCCNVIPSK